MPRLTRKVNRIITMKHTFSSIFPLQMSKYTYLAQLCISKSLRVSGWKFVNHKVVTFAGLACFSSVITPEAENKGISDLYGAGWTAGGEEVKVSVWWDFENCNVPIGYPPHKVSLNIVSALRTSGFKGPVTIAAYGDTLQLSRSTQEALCSTGIQIHHVPSGGKESDSSDRALLVDLMLWTIDHPPPAHLFLISGDRDFSNALHRLRMRNYNILLACSSGAHLSGSLVGAASNIWQWNSLVRGEGLLAKSSLDFKPSDGTSGGSFIIKNPNTNSRSPDGSSATLGSLKSSNNSVKVSDGTFSGGGIVKNSNANAKLSDGAAVGGQTLKSFNLKVSAPPLHPGLDNLSEEAIGKASPQSKFDSANISDATEEKGEKLSKVSEEKSEKGSKEEQDGIMEQPKVEHSAPSEVLQQFDDMLKAHPEGVWMSELQRLLSESRVRIESDYYGHKKLVPFLLTLPDIVRVERRIAKDNKTWTYFFTSSQFPLKRSSSASDSGSPEESSQMVPGKLSKQLIKLFKSHPLGLWLNEFQSELVVRKIEIDADFYGHQKIVPFLLSISEIVRVERRLMNDKKTWNYFLTCSQHLLMDGKDKLQTPPVTTAGRTGGLYEQFGREADKEGNLKRSICEEMDYKSSQVDREDYMLKEQIQEAEEVLDPKKSQKIRDFWKRAWQLLRNPFRNHSCNETKSSGGEHQQGINLLEDVELSKLNSSPKHLDRLIKSSGNKGESAPSSSGIMSEATADAQPVCNSDGGAHKADRQESGGKKSQSELDLKGDLKRDFKSCNSNVDLDKLNSSPKHLDRLIENSGANHESAPFSSGNTSTDAQPICNSDEGAYIAYKQEYGWKKSKSESDVKGGLKRDFKSFNSIIDLSHEGLFKKELVDEKRDAIHSPFRRKNNNQGDGDTIEHKQTANFMESFPLKVKVLDKNLNGNWWKRLLFGIQKEDRILSRHHSDDHSESQPLPVRRCVHDKDAEGVHPQVKPSSSTVDLGSSSGVNVFLTGEVQQGSANTSTLSSIDGADASSNMPSCRNSSIQAHKDEASVNLEVVNSSTTNVLEILGSSHGLKESKYRNQGHESPNELRKSGSHIEKLTSNERESFCSDETHKKVEAAIHHSSAQGSEPHAKKLICNEGDTFCSHQTDQKVRLAIEPSAVEESQTKKSAGGLEKDDQISAENPSDMLNKAVDIHECHSLAILEKNKTSAIMNTNISVPNSQPSMEKGFVRLDSKWIVEERDNVTGNSDSLTVECESKDRDKDVGADSATIFEDRPALSESASSGSLKQTHES